MRKDQPTNHGRYGRREKNRGTERQKNYGRGHSGWNRDYEEQSNFGGGFRKGFNERDNSGSYGEAGSGIESGNPQNSGRFNRDFEYDYPQNRYGQDNFRDTGSYESDYTVGEYSTRDYNRNQSKESKSGQGSSRRDEPGWWDRATEEFSSWFEDDGVNRQGRGTNNRGKGPKNYTRRDERIEEDINDRMFENNLLDASEVEVKVENGEVTLSGTVRNRQSKRLAEDIAEDVSGVKNVQNNLRVKSFQT